MNKKFSGPLWEHKADALTHDIIQQRITEMRMLKRKAYKDGELTDQTQAERLQEKTVSSLAYSV